MLVPVFLATLSEPMVWLLLIAVPAILGVILAVMSRRRPDAAETATIDETQYLDPEVQDRLTRLNAMRRRVQDERDAESADSHMHRLPDDADRDDSEARAQHEAARRLLAQTLASERRRDDADAD